jgi:hypothetical protein
MVGLQIWWGNMKNHSINQGLIHQRLQSLPFWTWFLDWRDCSPTGEVIVTFKSSRCIGLCRLCFGPVRESIIDIQPAAGHRKESLQQNHMVHCVGAYHLFQWHDAAESISTPPGQDVCPDNHSHLGGVRKVGWMDFLARIWTHDRVILSATRPCRPPEEARGPSFYYMMPSWKTTILCCNPTDPAKSTDVEML